MGGRRGEELEGDHIARAGERSRPNAGGRDGKVVLSGIETYGDTIHVFVERKAYNGVFLPGYQAWNPGGAAAVASSTSTTWSATSAGAR